MEHAPDLLLISQYDPELGEVAAFEELIGSHGGLGGFQTRPFILHPSDWVLDEELPLGAPAIYRNIRRWLQLDRDRAREAGDQRRASRRSGITRWKWTRPSRRRRNRHLRVAVRRQRLMRVRTIARGRTM